jgi:riboflavin biosynthesis pyrimidine reductase
VAGEERVVVTDLLDVLRARGLSRVLCEGGPLLLSQLVAADLLDELCLTLSPRLAGLQATAPGSVAEVRDLELQHALTRDSFLYLRYGRP